MMTPTELEQITEAQRLVELRQFRKALGILKPLADAYPQETRLQDITRVCEMEAGRYSGPGAGANTNGSSSKVLAEYLAPPRQEVMITFKNPGKLALAAFAVIVLAILVSYLIIILLIGFRLNFSTL